MPENIDQPNAPPSPRVCPFRFRKGDSAIGRAFGSWLVTLSMAFIAVGITAIVWHLYREQKVLYQSMALQGTSIQVESIRQFRRLYSDEVASRARSLGLELTQDYANKGQALPLPATLTMQLGEALSRERPGAHLRLYSDYPFPWRKESGGPRDGFEADALQQLRRNPNQPFYRFEEFRGRPSLRFAVADRMQASCVACHNSRPDSPKTDWKEGDVRGVLEFIRPLDNRGAAVAQGRANLGLALGATVAVLGVGLFGLGLTMRGLRRTSQSLRQSEERLRAVIDAALDAMLSMDAVGLITGWNPQAEAIFGWTRQEALGRSMSETIIPHRYREAHNRGVTQYLAGGPGRVLNQRIEITALRRNGHEFPVELSVTPLRVGDTCSFAAFVRDISERKAAEADLAKANRELVDASRQAGMAEVATGVLHNVGNVLNSVNVTSSCVADSLRKSKAANLVKVAALLREHEAELGPFFTTDAKGKQIPGYLQQLGNHLVAEQADALNELSQLQSNIEHIKDIVMMQQSFAKVSGVAETLQITDLIEDALRMNSDSVTRRGIEVIRQFEASPALVLEKHKVLQILVNLVRNARQSCDESGRPDKVLSLRVRTGEDRIQVVVSDNGVGIAPANLTRIFAHGFTTKENGHGFGLHSGALAAKELGGSLRAESEGLGLGATFVLELPCPPNSEPKHQSP